MKMIAARNASPLTIALTAAALLCAAASPALAAPPDADAPGAVAEANPTKARPSKKSTPSKKKAVKRSDDSRDSASRARVTTRKTSKRRDGAYFNGGLGVLSVNDQPAGVTLDTGTLALIGIGMRFTPELAIEGNLQAQFHDVQTGQDTASSDTLAGGSLSLKYFFPVMLPRVEGYAQGGLGYISLDNLGADQADLSGVTLEVGGGIEYRTNKQFAFGGRVGYSTLLNGALGDTQADAGGYSALSAMFTLNIQL